MSKPLETPSFDALLAASIHLEERADELKHRASNPGLCNDEDVEFLLDDADRCREVQRWLDEVRLSETEKL